MSDFENTEDVVLQKVPDPGTLLSNPTNLTAFKLQVKGKRVITIAILMVDPATGKIISSANPQIVEIMDGGGGVLKATVLNSNTDGISGSPMLGTISVMAVANGSVEDRVRTPTTFKVLDNIVAVGATAVWTPGAGKRARVMTGVLTLASGSACAGASAADLIEATAGVHFSTNQLSSAALTATPNIIVFPVNLPFNGYLASAINNAISVNLSGALTAGAISAWVCGTEE